MAGTGEGHSRRYRLWWAMRQRYEYPGARPAVAPRRGALRAAALRAGARPGMNPRAIREKPRRSLEIGGAFLFRGVKRWGQPRPRRKQTGPHAGVWKGENDGRRN